MNDWRVYILSCGDASLYTGISNCVPRRVATHKSGRGAKYTRARLPVQLVWQSEDMTRTEAARREYQIKQLSREEKLALVAGNKATIKAHIIRGKRYRITRLSRHQSKKLDGTCDDPSTPNKAIETDPRLKGQVHLETVLHEALHAAYFDLSEEAIGDAARDIARLLWRLGYRQIHRRTPAPVLPGT